MFGETVAFVVSIAVCVGSALALAWLIGYVQGGEHMKRRMGAK